MTVSLYSFAVLVAQSHEADADLARSLDQDSDAGQDVEDGEDLQPNMRATERNMRQRLAAVADGVCRRTIGAQGRTCHHGAIDRQRHLSSR